MMRELSAVEPGAVEGDETASKSANVGTRIVCSIEWSSKNLNVEFLKFGPSKAAAAATWNPAQGSRRVHGANRPKPRNWAGESKALKFTFDHGYVVCGIVRDNKLRLERGNVLPELLHDDGEARSMFSGTLGRDAMHGGCASGNDEAIWAD
jgi:hypothetical protein